MELIDFTDVGDVCGYGRLLYVRALSSGMISNGAYCTAESLAIAGEARRWVAGVEANVRNVPLSALPEVLDLYEVLHRVGSGSPARAGFVRRLRDDVFRAWKGGDGAVSLMDVLRDIQNGLRTDARSVAFERAELYCRSLERWVAESCHTGRFVTCATAGEAYHRAAILLAADLFAYTSDQDGYKRSLVLNYVPAELPEGPDVAALKGVRMLLSRACPVYVPEERRVRLECEVLERLVAMPSLNVYERRGYELERVMAAKQEIVL